MSYNSTLLFYYHSRYHNLPVIIIKSIKMVFVYVLSSSEILTVR